MRYATNRNQMPAEMIRFRPAVDVAWALVFTSEQFGVSGKIQDSGQGEDERARLQATADTLNGRTGTTDWTVVRLGELFR